jgi:hypothetical protein
MTAVNPDTSQQAVVEAALVLLERMGLSPADLTGVPQARLPDVTWLFAASAFTRGGRPGQDDHFTSHGPEVNRVT